MERFHRLLLEVQEEQIALHEAVKKLTDKRLEDELLTIADFARRAKVSETHVRRMISTGVLEPVIHGRRKLIKASELYKNHPLKGKEVQGGRE